MRLALILLSLMMFTACSHSQGLEAGGNDSPSTPVTVSNPIPSPSPSTSPSPTPSPSPSCKALKSVWHTTQTPPNQLMGIYLGPPTNGPTFDLDLTNLSDGLNTVKYDASHVCYYDVTVTGSSYILNSFQGCNPGVVPQGQPQNTQCDYCPYHALANVVYNFQKSCNGLDIQDTVSGQTLSYN